MSLGRNAIKLIQGELRDTEKVFIGKVDGYLVKGYDWMHIQACRLK